MPAVPRKSSSFNGRFNRALDRLLVKLKVEEVPHIKRIIVTVVGGTIVIFGLILIVTPGPAILVIPVGLAILGTEYAWARRWLRKARRMAQTAINKTQEPRYAKVRRWLQKVRLAFRNAAGTVWGAIVRPSHPAGEKSNRVENPAQRSAAHPPREESAGELVGSGSDGRENRRAL